MLNKYSLLAYLGPRLIIQLENLVTEALWYLLATYPDANDEFNSILSELGIPSKESLAFDPQIAIPEQAIPDLVGRDSQGKPIILVESKFGAPLTDNQPTSYIEQLPTDEEGMVVFLIPSERSRALWGKITQRVTEAGFTPSSSIGDGQTFLSVRVTPSSRLGYITWEHLLIRIKERFDNRHDERALGELWQLQGLVNRLVAGTDQAIQDGLPVSAIEIRATYLHQLVDRLVNELSVAGQFDTRGYRTTPGPGYYRRYGTVVGQTNWFIEYNENNARRFQHSLLWMGCPHSAEVEKKVMPLFNDDEFAPILDGDKILFPLSAPSEHGTAMVVDPLKQIERIMGLVRGDGE